MTHAIIVVGNERRNADPSRAFARYLRDEVGCHVKTIRGAYLAPDQLRSRLRKAVKAAAGDPLFVAYFGHGMPNHWSYALEHQHLRIRFPFQALAKILARHDGPIAVINDTCHAEGLKTFLEKAGLADRCMLISACAATDVSYGSLGEKVISRWREGKTFETIVERETLCIIDEIRYTPTFRELAAFWSRNAKIRLRNLFRPASRQQPTILPVFSPPNGWGVREEIIESVNGLRWGAELDRHFFPRKP